MRVVNQMIAAIRGACEACVKQERDTRDNIIAYIAEAKVSREGHGRRFECQRPIRPTPMGGWGGDGCLTRCHC